MSSSPWLFFPGGADALFNRCNAACACGPKGMSIQRPCLGHFVMQEKKNSVDVLRRRVSIIGFICAVAREPSQRYTFGEFEPPAVASRRRWRIFQQLICRLRMRRKNSAWASDIRRPCGAWQENNNTADAKRAGVNITSFICTVAR
jgi:hypothetical protein